jgi:predicted metal-dependent phosphoesterase TrpH
MSPRALIDYAKAAGLSAIALTDHDTVEGNNEAVAYGNKVGIEVIPGLEVSVFFKNRTMHILGYWVDSTGPDLQNRLALIQAARHERNKRIIGRLNSLGIDVSWEELALQSTCGEVGRPHIASLLISKGVVRSREEAFIRYLRKGAAAYVEREHFPAESAIAMIQQAGGLAVLAHPISMAISLPKLAELVKELQHAGLDGLEVYYPNHSNKNIKDLEGLASGLGLVVSGGSDFHGESISRVINGMAGENSSFVVPGKVLEQLRARRRGE